MPNQNTGGLSVHLLDMASVIHEFLLLGRWIRLSLQSYHR